MFQISLYFHFSVKGIPTLDQEPLGAILYATLSLLIELFYGLCFNIADIFTHGIQACSFLQGKVGLKREQN